MQKNAYMNRMHPKPDKAYSGLYSVHFYLHNMGKPKYMRMWWFRTWWKTVYKQLRKKCLLEPGKRSWLKDKTVWLSSHHHVLTLQIDVSKNQVRSVKKNFYKPPADLDLSKNRLKKMPAAKSKKKNFIHSIDVSGNSLTKLPPNIDNLVCMTRLDLSNNNLQEVRTTTVQCRAGNGSSFVTHDSWDSLHSWPSTHMTHDLWPMAITSFHPTRGTKRGRGMMMVVLDNPQSRS